MRKLKVTVPFDTSVHIIIRHWQGERTSALMRDYGLSRYVVDRILVGAIRSDAYTEAVQRWLDATGRLPRAPRGGRGHW